MMITEMIKQLEELRAKYGDLPVMLQVEDDYHSFPYYECINTSAVINKSVLDEETGSEEILNYIALDYM